MSSADIICAACGETIGPADRCSFCDSDPRLEGRYTLHSIVGHGAVGTTYRATDGVSGETVAIKEMPLRPTTPRDQVDRIEREARVLGQLRHDRIPTHHAHFTAGTGKHRAFHLVQEFVDGETLANEIKGRRYTEDEVLAVLDEVLEVLEYLHALAPPVIHRDLKPKNLMRRARDGKLVLIDFGAVRDVVQDPTTGGSTVAGTYGYMAPEQFKGEASPRSDLYAVGAMAVEMLSRRSLIDLVGVDHQLDWKKAVHASDATKKLIGRLLNASPQMRPGSAKAVRAEIARIRTGEKSVPADRAVRSYRSPAMPAANRTAGVPVKPVDVDDALRSRMGARKRQVAMFLAFIGGFWGLHHWYLGRYVWGFLSFVLGFTFIPFAVSLVQGIMMARMSDLEFDQKYNPALVELARGDTIGVAEQIRELHQLVKHGALSQAEFQAEKARLLGERAPNTLASLGTDLISTVFEQVEGHMNDLPAEVADQLGRHRRRLESKGLLKRSTRRHRRGVGYYLDK